MTIVAPLYNISNFSATNNPAEQLVVINGWTDGIFGVLLYASLLAVIMIMMTLKSNASPEGAVGYTSLLGLPIGLMIVELGLVRPEVAFGVPAIGLVIAALMMRGRS